MYKINIKPLSTNQLWQGRRFKTSKYIAYETELLYKLPFIHIPPVDQFHLILEIGFSNKNSDLDNSIKAIQDILQKRYKINDRMIYKLTATKKIVKKGDEYIKFLIESFDLKY
jgi:Holliday junction resolvase RusA-like endonuclease